MARVGQEMVNPVTRERFVWRETAASTGGSYCEFDLHLGEGATVARPHVHPHQQEDFRVESGTLRLRIGGQQQTLRAGDERTVVAGKPHAWANIGAGEAHVLVRLTSALRVEDFFETFCGLGRDGKLSSTGMPGNPLQLAVWAFAFRREIGLPSAVAPSTRPAARRYLGRHWTTHGLPKPVRPVRAVALSAGPTAAATPLAVGSRPPRRGLVEAQPASLRLIPLATRDPLALSGRSRFVETKALRAIRTTRRRGRPPLHVRCARQSERSLQLRSFMLRDPVGVIVVGVTQQERCHRDTDGPGPASPSRAGITAPTRRVPECARHPGLYALL